MNREINSEMKFKAVNQNGGVGVYSPLENRRSKHSGSWFSAVVMQCTLHPHWLIALATLLVFLPVFPLKLWLIDDHEIVWFLSRLRSDGLAGFWHQWLQLGDFGSQMPRFRPVYYFLRAIEILVWRDNSLFWVAARFGIVCIFTIRIYWLARKAFPHFIACLLAFSTLGVPWFVDVFFRLGPAETYAILFTALLLQSLYPKEGGVYWLPVAACIFMLVGIKENFAILIPLQLWAVIALVRDDKKYSAIVASGFVLLSSGCVAILAYKLHLSSGMDIYNQSAGAGRMKETLHNLFFFKSGWVSLSIVISCLYALLVNKVDFPRRTSLVVFGACIAILGFNLYFYTGPPDFSTRYAIPYWPILLGMFVISCAHIGKTNTCRTFLSDSPEIGRLVLIVLACIGISVMVMRNGLIGHRHVSATVRTDKAIAEILQRSKTVDEIVIRTAGSADYEPVYSISRFLEFRQVSKPLFLSVGNVDGANNFSDENFSKKLVGELRDIELKGGFGYEPARIRSDNNPHRCLEVVFQASALSVCSERVLVSY